MTAGESRRPDFFLLKTRSFVVAYLLEYFRAIARVPPVYFASSRLERARFSLKKFPALLSMQARPGGIFRQENDRRAIQTP